MNYPKWTMIIQLITTGLLIVALVVWTLAYVNLAFGYETGLKLRSCELIVYNKTGKDIHFRIDKVDDIRASCGMVPASHRVTFGRFTVGDYEIIFGYVGGDETEERQLQITFPMTDCCTQEGNGLVYLIRIQEEDLEGE